METQDATTTAPTDSRLEHLPLGQIDPDPQNRKVTVDRDFIASVREHGVLEPILVVPHPDDYSRFLIVAGERRWRAANKAGLDSVPAVVRPDMDEKARVEAQVTENLHRSDLAPCEEGVQLTRLITLGHTVKSLAAAVGRSQSHVRTRLKLVELPKTAQKLINDRSWSIDEGLAARELLDHPDQLDEIIASDPHNVSFAVMRALDQISYDARLAKLTTRIERQRLTVLDDLPRSGARLTALGIDPAEHRSEECHAYIVDGHREWGSGPDLVDVCVKPNRHRVEGPSVVKAPNRPGKTADERAADVAKKDAKTARRAAMATATITAKVNKGDCYDLILDAFVDGINHQTATEVCELLSLELGGTVQPASRLQAFAAKSEPNRLRTALAIAMVHHEEVFAHWGTAKPAARWIEWLQARGYAPSDWDRQHLAAKKRR